MRKYYMSNGGGEAAIAEYLNLKASGQLRWYTITRREHAVDEIAGLTDDGGLRITGAPWPPGRYIVGEPAATETHSVEEISAYGVVGIYRVEEMVRTGT